MLRHPSAMARGRTAQQFLKFLLSGGIAAGVNAGTGALLRIVLVGDLGYDASVFLGFVAGTVVSFLLNRTFTFQAKDGDLRRQIRRYVITAVSGILLATAIGAGALLVWRAVVQGRLAEDRIDLLAHLTAIGLTTIYNFVIIKYWAFGSRESKPVPTTANVHLTGSGTR